MTKVSLRQLEVFVRIAETGSFTQTAHDFGISQSTISTHLRTLEEELGVPLFDRSRRQKVSLTPVGEALCPLARRVIEQADRFEERAKTERERIPLVLGASATLSQYLLPEILAAYTHQHPDRTYLMRRGSSAEVCRMVLDESVRIGFSGACGVERLTYVPMMSDELVVVTPNSAHYRDMLARGAGALELLHEPMLVHMDGSGITSVLETRLQRYGIDVHSLWAIGRIDDTETVKNMVEKGAGISVLSDLMIKEELKKKKLLAFPFPDGGMRRELYMVTNPDVEYGEAERQLMDFIIAEAKHHGTV